MSLEGARSLEEGHRLGLGALCHAEKMTALVLYGKELAANLPYVLHELHRLAAKA
jgi:hypothetical protein